VSKIIKEITCITGSYTVANGEKKNRYSRIGSIIETKNGPMLKIDSIPLKEGGWDGWAFLNEPRPVLPVFLRTFVGFQDAGDTVVFGFSPFSSGNITVVPIVPDHLFPPVGDMGTHGGQPLQSVEVSE
jgi:hypothetical protein